MSRIQYYFIETECLRETCYNRMPFACRKLTDGNLLLTVDGVDEWHFNEPLGIRMRGFNDVFEQDVWCKWPRRLTCGPCWNFKITLNCSDLLTHWLVKLTRPPAVVLFFRSVTWRFRFRQTRNWTLRTLDTLAL